MIGEAFLEKIVVVFYGIVLFFIAAIVFVSVGKSIDVFGLTLAGGLALGLVALFLLRRRNARSAKSATGTRGFLPTIEQARKFTILLGLGGIVLGVIEGLALLEPDPSRQPARLTSLLATILGPFGPTVVYVALGIYLLLRARKRNNAN